MKIKQGLIGNNRKYKIVRNEAVKINEGSSQKYIKKNSNRLIINRWHPG